MKARPIKPMVRRRQAVFPPGDVGIKPVSAVVEPVSHRECVNWDGKGNFSLRDAAANGA
jgi:hypothetical protein